MSYATREQLASYLQDDVERLPEDTGRLLQRATELVQDYTRAAVYDVDSAGQATNVQVVAALRDATCAQVEFWMAGHEEDDVLGPTANSSVSNLSQDFGPARDRTTPMYLAPRADRLLRLAGLRDAAVYST